MPQIPLIEIPITAIEIPLTEIETNNITINKDTNLEKLQENLELLQKSHPNDLRKYIVEYKDTPEIFKEWQNDLKLLHANHHDQLKLVTEKLSDFRTTIGQIINQCINLKITCLELEDFREFIKLVDPNSSSLEKLTIGFAPYNVERITQFSSDHLRQDMQKLEPILNELFVCNRFPKINSLTIEAPIIRNIKGLPQFIKTQQIKNLDIYTCDLTNLLQTIPHLEELKLRYVENDNAKEWNYILNSIAQSGKIKKLSINLPTNSKDNDFNNSPSLFKVMKGDLESLSLTNDVNDKNFFTIGPSFGSKLKKIIDNPYSNLRHIKLPVNLIDAKTSEILCEMLQINNFFLIDLMLSELDAPPTIHDQNFRKFTFDQQSQAWGIEHNSELVLRALCLNILNKHFQAAYETKNLSSIIKLLQNYEGIILKLEGFLDIIKNFNIPEDYYKFRTTNFYDSKTKRMFYDPIDKHMSEIYKLSGKQIKSYAKGSETVKKKLRQEADAKYKQYFAECLKDDMFSKSSLDEREKFCDYAPKEFKKPLKEIEKVLSLKEGEQVTEEHTDIIADVIFEINKACKENKSLECKTDDTTQVNSLHNHIIGDLMPILEV